jgi:uridine kinase
MSEAKRSLAIGIAGGTGAGKSTFVRLLRTGRLADHLCVLEHDHYYRNAGEMPEFVRANNNWDHPEAIDNALFLSHLSMLKRGHAIERPVYSFADHARTNRTERIESAPIVLVEGILIFAIPEICEQIDWRIYLEASPDERILRRILRDTQERGRSLESVVTQYRTSTRQMHDEWIEPSRAHAHLIVPTQNESSLTKAVQIVEGFASQFV